MSAAGPLSIAEHADVLRCPTCQGDLWVAPEQVSCRACERPFPVDDGFVNFAPEIPRQAGTSLGQRAMENPSAVTSYESRQRVTYVRWMGKTQFTRFGLTDETRYLAQWVRPPGESKVLDLACGTGLATRLLVNRFGADRVFGLDVSYAMLERARQAADGCVLVRGSAMQLPVATASLGAVNCWDALQAIPEPPAAIAEVGRCLRPGGTFTCFTFRRSHGPYRWVQDVLCKAVGSTIYHAEQLSTWLNAAGMTLIDDAGPGHILLFTATKR